MDKNNIKRAAEIAGVSVASVSRALNGKPGISQKTRERVIEVCKELGYKPSQTARSLKIGRSSHVALFLGPNDKPSSHYVATLFEHLTLHLNNEGLVLNIYNYHEFESVKADSGSAIIIGIEDFDPRPDLLREASIPFVAIGKVNNGFWVCPDDEMGGRLAAQHLLELGCHRNIVIESDLRGKGTKVRAVGFQTYMQEHGFLASSVFVNSQNNMELHTYRTLKKLLDNNNIQCDAIFCENDEIAYGAIYALQDSGVKVPEDVKVIGFDGIPDTYDSITTIRQDFDEISRKTIELLSFAKKGLPIRNVLLPVHLVESTSTQK